jgi:hypothetical protein
MIMVTIAPRNLALAALLAVLLLTAGPAQACNVPVFRYALERWPADPYQVAVFHRGPLSSEDQALVKALSDADGKQVNCVFRLIDLDKEQDQEQVKQFEEKFKPDYPYLVVRYPEASRLGVNVWAGRLNKTVVEGLLDSPARRELARRILAGESAVWVLLESGRKDQDDAVEKRLQAQLKELPQVLKLPERSNSPSDRINEDGPPLKIAFSVLRVSRSDPAEALFVQMLLKSEEDLDKYTEPMVFPAFGRGRVLWALVGKGITEENVRESAEYLVGACSCEVKRMNPGVDLLVRCDWDERIEQRVVKDHPLPPLTSVSALAKAAVEQKQPVEQLTQDKVAGVDVTTIPQGDTSDNRPGSSSLLTAYALVATGVVLGLVLAGSAVVLLLRRCG